MTEREVMEYDVVIVGAGPAGLACAIRLKQLKPELSICVLEKGSAVGAHSLSGAVLESAALEQLLPKWSSQYTGMKVPAAQDDVRLMTSTGSYKMPNFAVNLSPMNNHGNFIISLGQLTPWLAEQAEQAGVDVFPGFAAAEALFDDGRVKGVRIGDMGLERDGSPGPNYTPGVEIHAGTTVLAEGSRGSITKQLIAKFNLRDGVDPPTFGLGFKELWQLPAGRVQPGRIEHAFGWPLDKHTYGGSFVYHLDNDRVYVGYVVGLNYKDPRLKPFEVFQQFKHHPRIKPLLEGGEILAAGARTIAAGGYQSLPKLEMPGAMLIGDGAGTLNVFKIKGIHQAIRSGVCAADHLSEHGSSTGYDARWRASEGHRELRAVRNFKPAFKRGLYFGMFNAGIEALLKGRTPWTLRNSADWSALEKLGDYASPDRAWVERSLPPRDRLASVFFAGNVHDESQPIHLKVPDTSICVGRCVTEYGNPCERFCPAGVYEMVDDGQGGRRLQINSANCVHCKSCDIKDPYENIIWTTPEGGSGPNYQNL
ncbi:electron transfer flavoprotein-ubiquinone oxidoreductase [Steroidobacter denitrificans]|uniref:Electron transfer flavoprotein-ubiquinone oxidoreductase n=1 Tax=Steroidobacter denitrificans TaxID=465721 RepID=A0A127FAV5_STEDE|nr:electron transfer flavoprotein-ubiquinone oxidoreductase [Steroidobacter denitrificans]AMN46738.1 electron transfer flavoprotein-ubiquinone oxidoreductase [Steroidobacter denitrificans]